MDARMQALPFDAAALAGLSSKLLTSHHQNNYGGAVKRLNAIARSWRRLRSPARRGSSSTA
jgi:Fe-Mn family superoxide dismutase